MGLGKGYKFNDKVSKLEQLRANIKAKNQIVKCLKEKSHHLTLYAPGLLSLPPQIKLLPQLIYLDCSSTGLMSLAGIEHLKSLKHLNCGGNQLSSLAGIEGLQSLTKLVCNDNQLTNLTSVKQLIGLRELVCHHNQLTSLADVKHLKALIKLSCQHNQLVSLAGVELLTMLQDFRCNNNQLTSLKGVERFKALTTFSCANNQLVNLDGVEHLTELVELYCSNNNLTSIAGVEHLTKLSVFRGSNNPVKYIPHAFLDDILSIRAYHDEINQHGYLDNNRLKLLFLGNGRVGKTTLAYALKEKGSQVGKALQESTIGISLLDWTINDARGKEWQVRIWDFGGQELYHATHRLFQSQSAIYCVLWAEKTAQAACEYNHPLRYWLDLIHDNNTDSPVIVVKNQIDLAVNPSWHDEALADERYSELPHYGVSALEYTNVSILESIFIEYITKQSELQIRIPRSWGKVRKKLEHQGGTISKGDFEAMCLLSGVMDCDTLLAYLNQCGDIFYRANHFSDTIFLDQNWVLNAIYRLFEISDDFLNPRGWIERNQGKVEGHELLKIFRDYEPQETVLFSEFMQQSQMIVKISGGSAQPFESTTFIVPALLPDKAPQGIPNPDSSTMQYRLFYPWLHRQAIERIIIECSHLSSEHHWWRNGIGITIGDNVQCSITADTRNKYLNMAFWGELADIKSELPRVIKTIESTKVASPTHETIWIHGKGWCQVDYLRMYAVLGDRIVDQDGKAHKGMAYYSMLDIECQAINEAQPATQIIFHSKETNFMTTTIINSPNAVGITGNGNKATVVAANIGSNNNEREGKMAELKAIKELLTNAEFPGKSKYLGLLKPVEDELLEDKPDTQFIGEILNKFSTVMGHLEKGGDLYNRVVGFLQGFGFTF